MVAPLAQEALPFPVQAAREVEDWPRLAQRLTGFVRGTRSGAERHVELARWVCAHIVSAFWAQRSGGDLRWFRPWPGPAAAIPPEPLQSLARAAASALTGQSVIEAGFLIGCVYTSLLPDEERSRLGAYYTPPVLAERLLDLAGSEGLDWSTARVLDPACGGGAFLTPVANRILGDHRLASLGAEERLRHLEGHLAGIEVDAFAAWMSQSFLDLLVRRDCDAAGRALLAMVDVADTLARVLADDRRFDLVVGNPPYRRVNLSKEERAPFERSLYGHANLYGLFLDAALRWRSPGGLVAYLTPTSFLGGQYHCRLRELIGREAPLLAIDFIEARDGVFPSVLQETCLAVFGPNPGRGAVVRSVAVGARRLEVRRVAAMEIDSPGGAPWLLARERSQVAVVQAARRLPNRLADVGYSASTGPLVWNRHRSQLLVAPEPGALPLIWAEAIASGGFRFEYAHRGCPFVRVLPGQDHLVERASCVLVQRTTAKEQERRLVVAVLPQSFLDRYGGGVVENHLDILRPIDPKVTPRSLALVLGSRVVDQLFRCLSGTVAVSAYELEALPLPAASLFEEIERHNESGAWGQVEVDAAIAAAYGLEPSCLD